MRDELVERLRKKGIEVFDDEEEGQRILNEAKEVDEILRMGKRKSASEIAVPGDESPFKATVISEADGAKVLNNLDNLAKETENITFIMPLMLNRLQLNPEDVSDAKRTKRKIQFRLKEAFAQADDAFVEIPTSIPIDWIENAINGYLKSSNHFHYVYVKYGDDLLSFESKNKPASH